MNVVMIDVPDAWGMLLSRNWFATLGGFLSMDLTHAHIPMGDGTFDILYSQPFLRNMYSSIDEPYSYSDDEFGVTPQTMD
jgi:hypothetical protein